MKNQCSADERSINRSVASFIPFDRPVDLGFGGLTADPVGRLDELAGLEVLVVHEEVLDGLQFERRHVAKVLDVLPARVAGGYAQHLVVAASLVGHLEHGDGADLHEHPGEQRFRQQNERVQRVAVLAESVLDEAVVRGIGHRGEQVAVQLHAARVVVHLVLVARTLRYLDEDVELHRRGSLRMCTSYDGLTLTVVRCHTLFGTQVYQYAVTGAPAGTDRIPDTLHYGGRSN